METIQPMALFPYDPVLPSKDKEEGTITADISHIQGAKPESSGSSGSSEDANLENTSCIVGMGEHSPKIIRWYCYGSITYCVPPFCSMPSPRRSHFPLGIVGLSVQQEIGSVQSSPSAVQHRGLLWKGQFQSRYDECGWRIFS